jgi:hypothetical protein
MGALVRSLMLHLEHTQRRSSAPSRHDEGLH